MKNTKGITLVALVITIIVLLILAGITINSLKQSGILNIAKQAEKASEVKQIDEEIKVILSEWHLKSVSGKESIIEFLEEKVEKGNIDSIKENADDNIEIAKERYYMVVNDKGTIVQEIKEIEFKFSMSNLKITLENSEEQVENYTQEKSTKLVINFDYLLEGGEITKIEPSLPYTTSGEEKEVLFKITGNKNGIEYIEEKRISVVNKYMVYADSFINGMEQIKESSSSAKIKVITSNETKVYNVNAIVYNGDLNLDGTNKIEGSTFTSNVYEFGNKTQDVATSSVDAKNMVLLKVDGDLTVNAGIKLTACKSDAGYGGPKGMTIYCTGTITNNGEISMTARGARADGENVYLWKNEDGSYEYVPAVGASGGSSVTVKTSSYTQKIENYYVKIGDSGKNGSLRKTAGGGSGGSRTNSGSATSGIGGAGTSYSGGCGGGGTATYNQTSSGYAGSSKGGDGGNGKSLRNGTQGEYAAGGGTGNKGGAGYASGNTNSSLYGNNGTGGLLVMYCNKIINNGTVSSNGTESKGWLAAGGSSGGGSINIFFKEEYQNNKLIQVDGGAKAAYGGAGGRGSISIGNISTGNYQSEYKNY